MNVLEFQKMKDEGRKISMVTCYDYSSARAVAESSIDCILVGDSLAMTMHGFPNTLSATTSMMALHTAAVARGAPSKFIVADLPFLSYRKGLKEAMDSVHDLMSAGAHAIKLKASVATPRSSGTSLTPECRSWAISVSRPNQSTVSAA